MFRRKELLYPHDDTNGGIYSTVRYDGQKLQRQTYVDLVKHTKNGELFAEQMLAATVAVCPEVVPDTGN